MGEANVRAMRDRPGFPDAARELARNWRMPADPERREFAESMRDLGRLMGALWAQYLHNTPGGLTLARLTALMEAGEVSGAGRARALLVYLQFIGYIAPAPKSGDARMRRYTPTARLVDGLRGRLERDFGSMAPISPLTARMLALLGRPEVFDLYSGLTGQIFLHYMMVRGGQFPGPSLETFSERYAGMMMLGELLATAAPDDVFPPRGPLRHSIAAIARACGVSRTQVRKALRDAAALGFLELPQEGLALPTDLMREHVELLIAGHIVGCEWAAGIVLDKLAEPEAAE